MPDLSRRTFLRFAAAGAAGAACSPRALPQKLVGFLVPPEEIVPGQPLFYRTVCRACPAGCGVTARTREGRAVKLEGNPEDPIGRGALCARGQAELQHLYAPDRLAGPRRRRSDGQLAPLKWDEAEDALAAALTAAAGKGRGHIRMLTRAEPGSVGAVQKALLRALGGRDEDRLVLEPFDSAPLRAAEEALFGIPQLPVNDLGAARTVVAFGADFLETWLSPVELTRQFTQGRGRIGAERARLWWVGPRLSATGMSADRWLRARAGGELALALALLRWLFEPGHLAALPPELAPLAGRVAALDAASLLLRAGLVREDLDALGRELAARRPSALLGPGAASQGQEATQLAAVLLLCNLALGNLGKTVLHGLDPMEDSPASCAEVKALLADCDAGAVDVLLLHHADPVGALPAALRVGDALGKVPLVVTFASRPDASGAHAQLHLPDHHPLEAFGEIALRRGVVAIGQPVMTPVADTRAAAQVMLELAGRLPQPAAHFPFGDLWEVLLARAELFLRPAAGGATDLGPALYAAQERGGVYSEAAPAPVTLDDAAAARFVAPLADPPPAGQGELDLVLFPTTLRGDGQGPRPPWLDEVSDTVTTLSWTAWAELSPATAARLGVAAGDLVTIVAGTGRVALPVYVYPGIRDDAVAIPLGGPEALALLSASLDAGSGALAFAGQRAVVTRAGRRVALPVLEGSPYQEGRAIVKNVSAAAPKVKRPDLSARMYDEPKHPVHRWALAIDLDKCTGCNACAVACYAENNVPVMGREAAVMGRQMGWIRIERYLGDVRGGRLRIDLMPMMCQQCTNAPCEPVCPVYATYHTPEGLNAQIYNRCVGTRYCSNNCPYKVRTFNWRDAQFARPLDWQLNPDVTVRSKGVMEKCTFCAQRIRYAEGVAKDQDRPVRDGEITPACAQTCPAQAIVFGDANDPASRVSLLSSGSRGFAALEEVNTRPAVTYLARVREEDSVSAGLPVTLSGLQESVTAVPRRLGSRYWFLVALAGAFVVFGGWCYSIIIRNGLVVTGLQRPGMWGNLITDFVFWVGIAHSGTLISAVLFLFRARFRTAVYRVAEMMTVFGVMTAGLFPVFHLGRPWFAYWLFPYPNQRQLWVNFRSPLVWDVFAVSTYFTVSVIFLLVGIAPDAAALRDHASGLRRRALGFLSLGWRGTDVQWRHYTRAYLFFAAFATPLVVSVHSVVSWDFAVAVTPGWHSTLFPPYFVAGAILSGVAMVITLLIPLRRALRLKDLITAHHLDMLARLVLFVSLIVTYSYAAEIGLSLRAPPSDPERSTLLYRATGPYAPLFWIMVTCNCVGPLLLAVRRVRFSVPALLAICLAVNVGMWLERFNIVVTSLSHDRLPFTWRLYAPSWVEWGMTFGSFGWFFFWFLLSLKLLPVISIAEMKEELAHAAHARQGGSATTEAVDAG